MVAVNRKLANTEHVINFPERRLQERCNSFFMMPTQSFKIRLLAARPVLDRNQRSEVYVNIELDSSVVRHPVEAAGVPKTTSAPLRAALSVPCRTANVNWSFPFNTFRSARSSNPAPAQNSPNLPRRRSGKFSLHYRTRSCPADLPGPCRRRGGSS